jgi:site-specific recombinase XerD
MAMVDNPKELKEKIRNAWLPKPKTRLEKHLEKAIHDFLQWMIEKGYKDGTVENHEKVLKAFLLFVLTQKIGWHDMFTWETLTCFKKTGSMTYGPDAVTALSRYLYNQKELPSPIKKPGIRLPRVYEDYLSFFEKSRQPSGRRIQQVKRVLKAFHDHLSHSKLSSVTIVDIDAFFAELDEGLARATRRAYRSILRGFLRYLFDRGTLKKDLSEMVVMAPMFGFSKPPSFLRKDEVQTLYDHVTLSCPSGLPTYAMLNLAHLLGLRGKEISLITLDDISFGRAEISIRNRKSENPIKLPLPETAIKAIAAYIVGARPKSRHRRLFLSLMPPFGPISPGAVNNHLKGLLSRAGLQSSAYSLRHTYAQNLLEAGVSIYEITEMMGHDSIRSAGKYLHIHIKLMREVLFDE